MANPIHEWIREQEDDSMSLEQLYNRTKGAIQILQERLDVAAGEEIDVGALEGEE